MTRCEYECENCGETACFTLPSELAGAPMECDTCCGEMVFVGRGYLYDF